jgi:hypothetical protein
MTKWYALNDEGNLVYVGEFETFEEADAAQPGLVWLIDEATAREWLASLKEMLE